MRLQQGLMLMCLFVSACSSTPPPAPEVAPEPPSFSHTVKYRGETLGLIAEWYTGSCANWQRIAAFNQGLDIKRIKIGQQIKIPAVITKRNAPYSQRMIDRIQASSIKSEASTMARLPELGATSATLTRYNQGIPNSNLKQKVNWAEVGDYVYPDARGPRAQ